jgi:acyl-CoA thioester hydrolase
MANTWAIETDIVVAWGEMDAFGHVNHTVYLRWMETARVEWFSLVEFPQGGDFNPILKTANAVYEAQVRYPDTVTIRVRAEPPGRTSLKLVYEVYSHSSARIVATGETVVVLVERGVPSPISLELRGRLGRCRVA